MPEKLPIERPAKRRSRRERQKADRRSRIYQAAMALFAQQGFDQATIQQITDRADVGKGTFFNYFPNKEAILIDYYRTVSEELLEFAQDHRAPTARAHLLAFFRRADEQARREGRLFDILIRELFARPALVEIDLELHERFLDLYRRLLRGGVQSGELRGDLDTDLAARLVGDIFSSTVLEWMFYEKAFSMSAVLSQKLDLLFVGFGAAKNP